MFGPATTRRGRPGATLRTSERTTRCCLLHRIRLSVVATAAVALSFSGCTSIHDYVQNGFKVGPNYCGAQAATAQHWIDANDARVREEPADVSRWWSAFNDPVLDRLIACAYNQNLSLRAAAFRILEARYQLAIDRGNLFPQTQQAGFKYAREGVSGLAPLSVGQSFVDDWQTGFALQWEIDLWGRLRRAILADEDTLEANCANYDDVLVTLLGDVATNYVNARTYQKRIELARANVELQRGVRDIAARRVEAGRSNELDLDQAITVLKQTEATIPAFQISLRQALNQLCILLGMPPCDLEQQIGAGPIPTTPTDVVVGVPLDLLRRRPDVRRAERQAAAQAEKIGIAEAQLYPIFTINGSMGVESQNFATLFSSNAFQGSIGPQFQWNILNYGRIINNVHLQDAPFRELVEDYRQTVLQANADVENGLITFLRSQEEARLWDESVVAAQKAVDIVIKQLKVGTVDFNRLATVEQTLVQQQDQQAQAYGQIGLGLISVYRAMGGGWQIRLNPALLEPSATPQTPASPAEGKPGEVIPAPLLTNPSELGNEAPAAAAPLPASPVPPAQKAPVPPTSSAPGHATVP